MLLGWDLAGLEAINLFNKMRLGSHPKTCHMFATVLALEALPYPEPQCSWNEEKLTSEGVSTLLA
jgi:hypothetical protein